LRGVLRRIANGYSKTEAEKFLCDGAASPFNVEKGDGAEETRRIKYTSDSPSTGRAPALSSFAAARLTLAPIALSQTLSINIL